MPELPEVETVVRTLRPRLVGRMIARVELRRPDIVRCGSADLPRRLRSRIVTDITRRGKKILFELNDGTAVCIHLGMTGRLTSDPRAAPLLPHTHMIWHLRNPAGRLHDEQLRFRDPRRFGGVWCLSCCADAGQNLGPEPSSSAPVSSPTGSREQGVRSNRPCSTSASSPASATSTWTKRSTSPASIR